jgi:DICT domain-containing protein
MIQKSSALVPSVVSLRALIVIEQRECECELFREVARRVRKGKDASTMSGRRTTFVCDKTHSTAIALTRRQHWGVPCTQKQRASKAKSSVATSDTHSDDDVYQRRWRLIAYVRRVGNRVNVLRGSKGQWQEPLKWQEPVARTSG